MSNLQMRILLPLLPYVVQLHTDKDDHTAHKYATYPDGMMRILMSGLNWSIFEGIHSVRVIWWFCW